MRKMEHRAVSLSEGQYDEETVKLARELGFNAVEFQTESGNLAPLARLAEDVKNNGFSAFVNKLGMNAGVWVHELEDYREDWGPVEAGNSRLWEEIDRKYRRIFTELLPWLDYIILTVVETEINLTSRRDVLLKLIEVLWDRCRKEGKGMVLRSFVWEPGQLDALRSILPLIPDGIDIMTKCVPQDWQLRSVNDPLIGAAGLKRQIVEVDIAGEYFRMDCVANCFTDILKEQYEHWCRSGCDGVSVRVSRKWKEGPYRGEHCNVINNAQEANLWYLGSVSSGKSFDEDEIWRQYTERTFSPEAARLMEMALRRTGQVVAEALHVGMLPFGDNKHFVPHSFNRVMNGFQGSLDSRYPAPPNLQMHARRYEDGEDRLFRNPFHFRYSPFRWEPGLYEEYSRTRRGEPEVIAAKEKSCRDAMATAEESLRYIDEAASLLPEEVYRYYRYRLEENKLLLEGMTEISLAWLKAERMLYTGDLKERERLAEEIGLHLGRLGDVDSLCGESSTVTYKGRSLKLIRGAYFDIPLFKKWFIRYFDLERQPVQPRESSDTAM